VVPGRGTAGVTGPIRKEAAMKTLMMLALVMGAGLLAPRSSDAEAFNFAGTAGNLGVDFASFTGTSGGVIDVSAYYLAGGAFLPANLYQRQEPNDNGLGVCSPVNPPGPLCGGGDLNELDNASATELLRLTLPASHEWVSVQLSSLDGPERGILWADADGSAGVPPGDIGDLGIVHQFVSDDVNLEPLIPIPSAFRFAPYLFFEPRDWAAGLSFNNDYLILAAETQVTATEPAAAVLVGLGLFGAAVARRRRP
jgi:hypothetical protein